MVHVNRRITASDVSSRRHPSGVIKHIKRHTPEDKRKSSSAFGDTHKCRPPTETHTPPHDDPRTRSETSGEFNS